MRLLFLLPLCLLAACRNAPTPPAPDAPASQEAPAAGTIVARAETTHSEDGLNRFTFEVTVVKAPEKGVYTVAAQDGPNEGETQFTLPKGAENFQVALRPGTSPTHMEIGFHAPGDTTFYPYYEVVSEHKTIRAQYTHAYRFE